MMYSYFTAPKTTTTYKTACSNSGFSTPTVLNDLPPRYSKDNGPLDNVKTPEDVRAAPWSFVGREHLNVRFVANGWGYGCTS